jgi:mono/diheme cytochrome c family protein
MELRGRRLFIYMTVATLAITLLFLLILIAGKNKVRQTQIPKDQAHQVAPQIPEQNLNPTTNLLKIGSQVYAKNCATCHGDSGRGDGPDAAQFDPKPRNLAADSFKFGLQPSELYHTITTGIPGTMMASFQFLGERDCWAVVQYIRTFRPNEINKNKKN